MKMIRLLGSLAPCFCSPSGKKSSGLGLCFVREAALLHQGHVALENRDGGKGTRAVLTLPLA